MRNKLYALTGILLMSIFSTVAQVPGDSAKISILTSLPSDNEIYTAWGHTAIRVHDSAAHYDKVYNYGIFSFGDDFVFRFVKGETDYRLGRTSMAHALMETMEKNCDYYEQELNLTPVETKRIINALETNYLPENRIYRYKFFTDNCATRPKNIIETNIDGHIIYPSDPQDSAFTYRDYIYSMLGHQKWYNFGIDLLLGVPCDKKVGKEERMFLPVEMMNKYAYSSIHSNGKQRPLVSGTHKLLSKETEKDSTAAGFPSPLIVFTLLAVAIAAHIAFYVHTGRDDRWFYLIFFGALGILGCITFFVRYISVHEFVAPNINLLWESPLQLAIACLIYASRARSIERILFIMAAAGCALCLLTFNWLMPQHLNPAFFPLILSEAALCASWLYRNHKKQKNEAEKRQA